MRTRPKASGGKKGASPAPDLESSEKSQSRKKTPFQIQRIRKTPTREGRTAGRKKRNSDTFKKNCLWGKKRKTRSFPRPQKKVGKETNSAKGRCLLSTKKKSGQAKPGVSERKP